jgi:hypothetical protein
MLPMQLCGEALLVAASFLCGKAAIMRGLSVMLCGETRFMRLLGIEPGEVGAVGF